ncbi:MAG TPA: cytochrome c oxidase subunit I [Gemmatimonadales bacterium]|nr:cytochrome c oxidase subunit I [Gemmatimonadales bacterium]
MATLAPPAPAVDDRLTRIWETPRGIGGMLSTVDHKTIGKRYLVTSFVFLVLGGVEAAVMRAQLIHSNLRLVSPEVYNQLYSMHGVTMMFLYASPVLSGFSNYLWPLLIGSRDMAVPRLNALSYWIFLASGIFLYSSFLVGQAPNDGWFAYAPFSLRPYDPGLNMDYYALGLVFLAVSTTVGAINFIVTFFKLRAPGMSVNRVPIIMWGTLTASVAIIFSLSSLTVACIYLFFERRFGMHFYDPAAGGQPLLWQHLFWILAHPWVYVVVLPAMGIVSDVIPTFARRPLVGYTFVALATVATGILGFGVWVHHMFATGLSEMSLSFFGAASMVIAIPSAVAVFAWIATIWTGRPVFTTAFLFMAGFIILFVIGGVSGVVTAAVPFDWQVTDTYFVVGHIHYVLIGINVFPVVGGLYYWLPKMTGRMLSERLGKWNFWVMFVGFNLGFFPMHISGLLGMPRRIYTYPSGLGWDTANLITSIGAYLFAVGVLLFVINFFWSLRRGRVAGPDPWRGPSLEWSTSSPPPPYNFAVIPTVRSAYPMWERPEQREEAGKEPSQLDRGPVLDQGRETVGTSSLDGEPLAVLQMPSDSYWPFLLAFSLLVLFFGLLAPVWALVVIGGVGLLVCVIGWLWPTREERELAMREEAAA